MVIEDIKLTENENQARMELSYEWVARYKDGTELRQYDDEKQLVHHFGHIDQDRIYEFEIIPTKESLYPIKVNLDDGLFYFDNKPVISLQNGDTQVNLGLSFSNKSVSSSWGNKAKLIYVRHVRRNFVPGPNGFGMDVHIDYELGWEADVDGVHEKRSINIDEHGNIQVPKSFEDEGFLPL